MRAAVFTISDKGSRGERKDESGPAVAALLESAGISILVRAIIPDELSLIEEKLIECADHHHLDIVVTIGGTGVSPRDVTPDATRRVIERELPGMAEAMRMESFKKTPHAVISRALCGIRGKTLIINLPGSPRGAVENLQIILSAIPHAVEKIKGDPSDCASS
ncbi:MAG: MogA/MoaB family molybdenum cofactor biosynthesis protein [Desulfobacterota bacterium]|nr:MogA/MoaB family molybdenum cofactor biosynthesis protein [Thermodesulfobacteriota bacterium]